MERASSTRPTTLRATGRCPRSREVLGAVNEVARARDVVVCAAGSMPGDLHKLWRPRDPKGYHVEYGYSCMGYEIAGGLGVKMACDARTREVFVMVGDGSYLMMAQELVTAVQEGVKLIVVLVQNHGFASIGALSESVGAQRFGTRYRYRTGDAAARRRRAAGRPRRQRRQPRRRRARPRAPPPSCATALARRTRRDRDDGRARRDRPAAARAGQRGLVGRPGRRGLRRWTPSARRAPATRRTSRPSAPTCRQACSAPVNRARTETCFAG